jgi:tetratricopeptide (TPR) repeat protein
MAVALTPRDRARLAPDRAVDPEVFDLYVRGTQARYLSLGSDAAYRRAMTFFARAVARDSTYAPAHAGLALAASFVGDEAAARRALARALALDPSLAEAHMALGLARQAFDRDWTGAEAALREAIHLNPGYAEAHHELSMVLLRGRRFDEALREARETVYLAPMSARFENGLGEVLHYAGRHAEALAAADKSLALDPASAGAQLLKASAHLGLGQYTEAASTLLACTAEGCGGFGRGLLAYAYARAGRPDAARLLVDSLRGRWADPAARSYVAYDLAVASMGLGEPDQALVWLERGARTATGQSGFMAYVGVEPAFLPLHGLTRFQAVLRALGLPDR